VQIEGTADIVELPEAMDGLVDYYWRISGEHPDWDDYRAAMERDNRVLLRITITSARPDVSGRGTSAARRPEHVADPVLGDQAPAVDRA
jgi:hypothetical protein